MITPSSNNPLPWSKRKIRDIGIAALWAIVDANGNEVGRLDDITAGGEVTADFIVAAANVTARVVPEIDARQGALNGTGRG